MTLPVKTFIVDDSALMRRVLTAMLEQDPAIQVVGYARDGQEAMEKIPRLRPQVVTLDVEMPGMDGLETLERLMCLYPVPVLMVSALTTGGAEATLRALELGAVDFVTKPARQADLGQLAQDLTAKVKAVAGLPVTKVCRPAVNASPPADFHPLRKQPPPRVAGNLLTPKHAVELVAIGASTGGPSALHAVMRVLPADFPAGILIVQHIPPGFTKPLAQRLNENSRLEVKEAEAGDVVRPGRALVAPAGWQMSLETRGDTVAVRLERSAPVQTLFKPSVDVLFLSVAEVYGDRSLGVILTGMGNDGVRGLKAIKDRGGKVLAEAESSCIVFGMPKAAIEAGVVDKVAPLPEIAAEITTVVV